MEQKTKISAEAGKHDVVVTREFDLPVELLFKAYTEPELLGEWMGTKVLKLESKQQGGYQYETTDGNGKVVFKAHGVIHGFTPNEKITRTFEMENTPFGVQLELLQFEPLTATTSKLNMHVLYETPALRDQVMQFGFAPGINMAHNRLEEVVRKVK